MSTVSARVPDDLEEMLGEYLEEENLDRSVAVRKFLSEGLERWRRERALEAFSEGTVSFLEAADMAGMDVWEFQALLESEKIQWVSESGIEKDLEAV